MSDVWAYQRDPFIAGVMQHLQCDEQCKVSRSFDPLGRSEITHTRDGHQFRVTAEQVASADFDAKVEALMAALEPLKAQHWHEPIPNWVGEAVMR